METTIRIKRIRLGGLESIDIRRCHNGKPTKSGISLPPEKIEEIIRLMQNCNSKEEFIKV